MKMNGKQKLLEQVERRGLLLVALAAMVLSFATVSSAQSGVPSASSLVEKSAAAGTTTQAPNAVAKPPATSANARASAEEKPAAKGTQEGIKVHGHWTIEVRNPDGTVDKHVEFENQICPDQTYTRPVGTLQTIPVSATFQGGVAFFSGLASGQASAGGWAILLATSAEANTAPVPPGCLVPLDVFTQFNHIYQPSDVFNILQSNMQSGLLALCQIANTFPTPENCSTTLTPPPTGPSISLNGFIQVPQSDSGTIAVVSTANFWCNDGGATSPTACLTTGSALGSPSVPAIVTGTQIPGPGVSYLGGQTIAVSVLISFQ
jgi:hypothetical protein